MVALKEIPLSDVSIFGATEAERTAGLGRMGKEVEILSSLNHPNIVQVRPMYAIVASSNAVLRTCPALRCMPAYPHILKFGLISCKTA
jgi:hypothetical protein